MATQTSPIEQPVLLPRPGSWRVDPSRSRVAFAVRKLGAGTVRGSFADVDGELVVAGNQMSALGSVRVASMTTGNEDRDSHLRSPGLFAADEFPEIVFVSREVVGTAAQGARIRGDLTIRDRSREVELSARPADGPDGASRLEVRGEIDRRDFGLTWNRGIEASGVISTKVRIELDLLLVAERALASDAHETK